jgi:hypothetical protein
VVVVCAGPSKLAGIHNGEASVIDSLVVESNEPALDGRGGFELKAILHANVDCVPDMMGKLGRKELGHVSSTIVEDSKPELKCVADLAKVGTIDQMLLWSGLQVCAEAGRVLRKDIARDNEVDHTRALSSLFGGETGDGLWRWIETEDVVASTRDNDSNVGLS